MEISGFYGILAGLPFISAASVVLFVLALIFRQPWKKALQGGIKIGMGALSMWALSMAAIKYFAPAVQAMTNLGGPFSRLTLVDGGWTGAMTTLINPMMWINLLIFALINIGLILIRATKTLYVDFPCMWRGVWTGMVVWALTGSYWLGTAAMMLFLITDLFLADWNAKRMHDYHGFANTASFPNSQNAFIIGAPLAWLLARIPGIKSLNVDGTWVKDKLGFFAEPMVLGAITGVILGALARFAILEVLVVGMVSAMMFHFWPLALGLVFDGWSVFTEALRNRLVGWMKGKREVYIAVDTSVLLGHPSVAISTTLMYPLAFLLCIVVPGIGLFPIISVQIIQWWMAHITGWTRGNIIHNLLICSVLVILYGLVATAMAEPYTFWLQHYSFLSQDLIDAGVQVTNWDGGGDLRIFLIYKLFSLLPG